MKFKLSTKGRNFKKNLAAEWQQLNQQIGRKFDTQMDLTFYEWPRNTRTKSGSPPIKGSPRKITDTGELKNSRRLSFSSDGLVAVHTWEAEHAALVLMGGTNKNGTYLPPRDWITPVLFNSL